MIKFSQSNPLVSCWIMVNIWALLAICGSYLIAWHFSGWQNTVSPNDVRSIVNSSSKEQLLKLCLDEDSATRGAVKGVFFILHIWLGITLMNVFFAVAYFFRAKQNIPSQ